MIQIEHFRSNEEFVKRIYDQIDQMKRQQRMIITPFLSPDQCVIVETICGNQVRYECDGGFDQAERKRFVLLPYDMNSDFEIACLKATYQSRFGLLTHRDVLGALMQLGIERERIGDILVSEESVYIFAHREIEQYLCANLTKIKRYGLHFRLCDERVTYEAKITYKHYIVSSLRIDVIVAAICHVSRAKAQEFVHLKLVKVNHEILEQTSYLCNNDSAISIRSYGRFHFKEVLKMTKKDHYVVDIGIYQ